MNLLLSPDTNYLLNASLESLHEDSCQWIEEINFWQNEMSFFYKLLNKRMPTKNFPSEILSAMEKKLVDIQTSVLDETKNQIIKHEHELTTFLQNTPSSDEEEFRKEHRRLLKEICAIQELIRSLKSEVFSLF